MTSGRAVFSLSRGLTYSVSGCRGWLYYELIFAEVLTLAVEVILVMRCESQFQPVSARADDDLSRIQVYVLYSHNKIILGAIVLAMLAEVTIMAVMLGITLPRLVFKSNCIIISDPGIFVGFW